MFFSKKGVRHIISLLVAILFFVSSFSMACYAMSIENEPVISVSAPSLPNDSFNGGYNEWDTVEYDGAIVTTPLTLMKAVKTDSKVLFYVEGKGLTAADNIFYIDSDNNAATGYSADAWNDGTGIDYKIVNDKIYKYEASVWVESGTAEIVTSDTGIEVSIDTSKLGKFAHARIKVGYSMNDNYFLPEVGSKLLMVDSAISLTGGRTIIADGDNSDWSEIPPVIMSEDKNSELYLARDNVFLYMMLKGNIPDAWTDTFLDTDNNSETGCTAFGYADLGADYMPYMGGTLYKSKERSGYSWETVPTGMKTKKTVDENSAYGTIMEYKIPLIELQMNADSLGKVGIASFYEGGTSALFLPKDTDGLFQIYNTSPAAITLDGTGGEWENSFSFVTNANKTENSLKAVLDHKKLYTYVKTGKVNLNYTYFIDSDNNNETGYRSGIWSDGGSDYKVEKGKLYQYIGTGSDSNWTLKEDVYVAIYEDSMEMSLNLKQIGKSEPGTIKIAYVGNNVLLMPESGSGMLDVNKIILRSEIENAYYPEETYQVLNNPNMGWAPLAYGGPFEQPHKLAYIYTTWRELEPVKGEFAWEAIESKFKFNYWNNLGVKFILRVVMDYPTGVPHKDIPEWLYEEIEGDGTHYNTGGSAGFSPDYSNPTLISEHGRMISALAEKYDNDPRIAYIALGSLGHWGEWHTGNASDPFPTTDISDQYVQHYVDNFKNKLFGMRKPYVIAKEEKLGLFNDMMGTKSNTDEWLDWIDKGLTDPASAMSDFWKYNYSGGEFSFGNPLMHIKDITIVETLRQVRMSHTSWIGPCTAATLNTGLPEQGNIDMLLKTMGYRFVLESVAHITSADTGSKLSVSMNWNNRGIAPMYYAWPLELSLVKDDGTVVASTVTDADIRTWLPGKTSLTKELDIPANLPSGTYKLAVAILDPGTNKPGIDLAIEGRNSDGRYILDTVAVNNITPSTPAPTPVPTPLPTLSTVSISGNSSVEKGSTVQLSVSGRMSNNEPANLANATIQWSIDKENFASINKDSGLLSAVKAGTAKVTVTVTLNSKTVSSYFDITVTNPKPTPTPTPAPKFNDIGSVDWASEAIEALADRGIINGVGNNEFAPNKNITRADFILMVVKALELESEAPESFSDVPTDAYYASAVGIAKKLGIVSGIGEDNFGPSREISRQDMMVILANALEFKGMLTISEDLTALNSFNDKSEVAGYAKARINALIEKGFVNGTGNNQITPAGKATRAQVAVLLYKLFK